MTTHEANAEAAYISQHANACDFLAAIQEHLQDIPCPNDDPSAGALFAPNWAHVADIRALANTLGRIARQLKDGEVVA